MQAILNGGRDILKYFDWGYLFKFVVLLLAFRYFNLAFVGITDPKGLVYSPFLDNYLNYVDWIKSFLLYVPVSIVNLFGIEASVQGLRKIVMPGSPSLILGMPCVGLGMLSFWAAFVLPQNIHWKKKALWTVIGIIGINLINCTRITLMAFAVSQDWNINRFMNHHDLFKLIAYGLIGLMVMMFYQQQKRYEQSLAR